MLALIITSLLARPDGPAQLAALVHWTAYGCWPVAVLHGLGTGQVDTPVRWVLALTALCVLAITGLTLWRLALAWPAWPVASTACLVVVVLMLVASGAWLRAGPLAPGWSARSGTHSSSQPRAEPPPHTERR